MKDKKRIKINSLYDSFKDKVKTTEARINYALSALRESRIEVKNLDTLKAISGDWLRSFIDGQKTRAKESFSGVLLPDNIISTMEAGYRDMFNNCLTYAESIYRDIRAYPSIKYELREGEFWYNVQDVEKAAEEASYYEFTKDDLEYYGYLEELAAIKTKIHTFEKERGYCTTSRPDESFLLRYNSQAPNVDTFILDSEDGGFTPVSFEQFYKYKELGCVLVKEESILQTMKENGISTEVIQSCRKF